uniref:Uncharacterized protein n=1 Tax=Oryza barthii TaxID=65489 RepID=A0A0D3FVT2_9ORYZ
MGRVGADGLLPRFIWAAPLVGVVGETARGRRHGGGSLSLSLPVGLRMVAKMTTQQDGVDTLTWALEKNNGYSSRFPFEHAGALGKEYICFWAMSVPCAVWTSWSPQQ